MNIQKNEKYLNRKKLLLVGFWLTVFCFSIVTTAKAQSYPCTNAIYFTAIGNTNVFRYTPSTNQITQLSGVTNGSGSAASAITPDGSRLYYVDSATAPALLAFNTGSASTTTAATVTVSSTTQRNGIDPFGTGYFMVGVVPNTAEYYRYTTGGSTSTISGPFNLTVQPTGAPAIARGGDITFDSNGIGYLVDQSKNFYRLDFTNNIATYIGAITGMGSENPNGLGFSRDNSGNYELFASTLNNILFKINLTTLTATQITPSSTASGFAQNDIATCIYPPNLTPAINAAKAWRNVTKNDPADFSASTAAVAGDTIEYRVIVSNGGAISAGNTTLQDTIPTGFTYTAGTTTLNGSAVTDSAGTGNAKFPYQSAKNINSTGQGTGALKVGSTQSDEAIVLFRVTVDNPFDGTSPVTNTAHVNYAGSSGIVNSNTVSTTVNVPDLHIAKSHTGNFIAGTTGTYTLTVSNTGTSATSGTITVTDTLPTGLSINNGAAGAVTPGGANAANWACNSNAASPQIITCTSSSAISQVNGSNTSVFTLTVNIAAGAATPLINNASVSGGSEPAANTGNNSASDSTTIIFPPNIALVKTCSFPMNCESAVQLSGTDLTYKITFTNNGGQGATNFSIVDPNPAIGTLKLNNNTDFKVGSVSNVLGTTGLTVTITYSNDSGSTYTYTPVSGGGGAPAGYDRNVTHIRWAFSGTLSQIVPNNEGNVSFIVRIR